MDIKNKSKFIEYFSQGIKDKNQLKIGVEHERFLFESQNKKRISYKILVKLFENLKIMDGNLSLKRKCYWDAKRQSTNYY